MEDAPTSDGFLRPAPMHALALPGNFSAVLNAGEHNEIIVKLQANADYAALLRVEERLRSTHMLIGASANRSFQEQKNLAEQCVGFISQKLGYEKKLYAFCAAWYAELYERVNTVRPSTRI